MKIPLAEIDRSDRKGYSARLLAHGRVVGNMLEISMTDYIAANHAQVEETSDQIYWSPGRWRNPGDTFAFIIRKITKVAMCRQCRVRVNQMNEWGWWKCWRERETIVDWLCEEASTRGHVITRRTALALFKAGLKEVWQYRRSYELHDGAEEAD